MICAACHAELDAQPLTCPGCDQPALLRGRYRLIERRNAGSYGTLYAAWDLHFDGPVAVKEVPARNAMDPKVWELVQREASVLRQLDHPGIPTWREDFVQGEGRERALYLVQELVEGQSLDEEMASRRYTEDEVLATLEATLTILTYLHSLSPPVIHRDVKPGNLMRRADGGLSLVDFGAVRDILRGGEGSTVAGTFGYMAPEQFRGEASPATDIFGAGMVAVRLLSRKDAAQMWDYTGRVDWAPHVHVSGPVAALLDDMLQPDPADRAADADALASRIGAIRRGEWAPPAPPQLPATRTPAALAQKVEGEDTFVIMTLISWIFCQPLALIAWWLGRPVMKQIEAAAPGTYRNEGLIKVGHWSLVVLLFLQALLALFLVVGG